MAPIENLQCQALRDHGRLDLVPLVPRYNAFLILLGTVWPMHVDGVWDRKGLLYNPYMANMLTRRQYYLLQRLLRTDVVSLLEDCTGQWAGAWSMGGGACGDESVVPNGGASRPLENVYSPETAPNRDQVVLPSRRNMGVRGGHVLVHQCTGHATPLRHRGGKLWCQERHEATRRKTPPLEIFSWTANNLPICGFSVDSWIPRPLVEYLGPRSKLVGPKTVTHGRSCSRSARKFWCCPRLHKCSRYCMQRWRMLRYRRTLGNCARKLCSEIPKTGCLH